MFFLDNFAVAKTTTASLVTKYSNKTTGYNVRLF